MDRIFKDDQHLLFVDFIVPIQISVFNKLPHLHWVHYSFLPQVDQSIIEELQYFTTLKLTIVINIIFLKDIVNCLPNLAL